MLLVDASARESDIHGAGLFANQTIPAATAVWILKPGFDVVLTKQALDELSPFVQEQIRHYIYIDVVTGLYVLCSDDARFMNHADNPNTKTAGDRTWAVREIQAGEELTCDYREFDAATRNKPGFAPRHQRDGG